MSRETNPKIVGAFVLGALALIVVVFVVFGSGKLFQPLETYVTYFRGNVKGLKVGSPVLVRGVEIGKEAGLRYVYAGNLPGMVGDGENTRCPGCDELLIERYGFRITSWNLEGGSCPSCGTEIAGRWKKDGGA